MTEVKIAAKQSRKRVPRPDYQSLFESAPALYLVLAPDLTIVAVSDAYLAATMTVRDEILGRALFEVFPDNPDDPGASGVANLRASLERVLRTRQSDAMAVQKYDIRRPASGGGGFEERFWSPVNCAVLGANGELKYIIHRVEDVTEFLRLKRAGREQSKVTKQLKAHAVEMEAEIFRRAQQIQAFNAELRKLHQDLESRVERRTVELRRANEKLEREIVERKRAEEALRLSEQQLRQAQKLEAIGRLAGGIAHDFNNLLTVVLSYSALLLGELPNDSYGREEIEEIKRAGERAAELTRQLLAFSRQQLLNFQILDLNQIVGGLTKMLGRLLGEDIELRLSLAPRLGCVRADPGQIEQVIMNLVVNSRDAMPTGGQLAIETAEVVFDEAYARKHPDASPGPHVMLAVSDTGTGMDEATQARVFEPFFTTKERGKGTGLGLSTVFGIVKQSQGNICLFSELGAGSTFRIYLPVVEAPPTASVNPGPPKHAPKRGVETILLAEDEDQVRTVACGILRKAGYEVLPARRPEEAIALCESHPREIHLLLTDLVMSSMNGRQLAERVRAMRPRIGVAFISGYTDDIVLHQGVLDPDVTFVQKPLTPDVLVSKVALALSRIP